MWKSKCASRSMSPVQFMHRRTFYHPQMAALHELTAVHSKDDDVHERNPGEFEVRVESIRGDARTHGEHAKVPLNRTRDPSKRGTSERGPLRQTGNNLAFGQYNGLEVSFGPGQWTAVLCTIGLDIFIPFLAEVIFKLGLQKLLGVN